MCAAGMREGRIGRYSDWDSNAWCRGVVFSCNELFCHVTVVWEFFGRRQVSWTKQASKAMKDGEDLSMLAERNLVLQFGGGSGEAAAIGHGWPQS